ncbi:MAG TPA: NnrS family protein [Usitatibacter sp.]
MTTARAASASRIFFPLAAAYALLVLPASVLPMLGIAPLAPGLASPAAHAHELLFGFALLVVAGHQLGQPGARRLGLLLALWAAARLSFLFAPASLAAAAANVAFAVALGAQLVPRLFTSAKKLRNLALPLVLAALAACAAAVELARAFGAAALERTLLTIAVIAFSLLMLFMGGRLIAPAAAGQFYRQGGNLQARVQPRIEAALIVLMLVAIAAAALPAPRAVGMAGAAALVAGGILALVRLARWRLWEARGRPDLACIGIGYAWVAGGLVAWGASLAAGSHSLAMLHAITVGGLGTLTFNVMALTGARLARADPAASAVPQWGTALLAIAAVARIAADFAIDARLALLALAAGCWSAAFALLLARFAALAGRTR